MAFRKGRNSGAGKYGLVRSISGMRSGLKDVVREVWTPSSLFDGGSVAGFWANLDAAGAIAYTTQPTFTDSGAEEIGTASWGSIDATLSKESGARPGGSGSQVLRVTATAGSYFASRPLLTVGLHYNIDGWFKASGLVDLPVIYVGSYIWTGVSSIAWQYGSASLTTTSGTVLFGSNGLTVGQYVDCDDMTVVTDSVTSVACKGTITSAAQLTAANMPYYKALGARNGIYFETNDGLVLGASKTEQRFLHDGTGCTLCLVANISALGGTLLATYGAAANTGFLLLTGATGTISAYVGNSSGTNVYQISSAAGALVTGRTHLISVRFNSSVLQVYVDGLLVAEDTTPTGAFDVGDALQLLKIGNIASSSGALATLADAYGVAKYASAAELAKLHRFFADKHGIKLVTDALTEAELATWDGLVSWLDPNAVTIQYNTQPTITNSGFTAWTGDNPDAWSVSAESGTEYITQDANGARIVSSGPYIGMTQNTVLVSGNRYKFIFDIAEISGSISTDAMAMTPVSSTGVSEREGTSITTQMSIKRQAACNAVIKSIAAENISVTSIPERVGGGSYTQLTAATMPWWDATNNGVRFADAGDGIDSSRAKSTYRCLHDGTGGTFVCVARIAAYPAVLGPFWGSATGASPGAVGAAAYISSTGAMYAMIGNGSGTAYYQLTTGAGVFPVGTKTIATLRVGAAFADLRKNDASVNALSPTGSPDTGDSAQILRLGNYGGGTTYGLNGEIGESLMFSRILSLSEMYRLNRLLATKHTVTL